MALVDNSVADAEIVWNKRFFRAGVWKYDLVGGKDFTQWTAPTMSKPIDDIEKGLSLLEGEVPPILILGHDVVQAFRVHPAFELRARLVGTPVSPALVAQILKVEKIVTAATVFNAGWSQRMEFAVAPRHALLIRAKLKPGVAGFAQECGSSYVMERPDQGVFFYNAV